MFTNDTRDTSQFRLAESVVVRDSHRHEPELGDFAVPLHVNVRRLVSVEPWEMDRLLYGFKDHFLAAH